LPRQSIIGSSGTTSRLQADAEGPRRELQRPRDELLNESLFLDLDHARQFIGAWVTDYNTARPHSSLGYQTPAAYAEDLTAPRGEKPVPRLWSPLDETSVAGQDVFAIADLTRKQTDGYFNIKRADGSIDPSGIVKSWAIWELSFIAAGPFDDEVIRGVDAHRLELSSPIAVKRCGVPGPMMTMSPAPATISLPSTVIASRPERMFQVSGEGCLSNAGPIPGAILPRKKETLAAYGLPSNSTAAIGFFALRLGAECGTRLVVQIAEERIEIVSSLSRPRHCHHEPL
jgi:hypothetical protein